MRRRTVLTPQSPVLVFFERRECDWKTSHEIWTSLGCRRCGQQRKLQRCPGNSGEDAASAEYEEEGSLHEEEEMGEVCMQFSSSSVPRTPISYGNCQPVGRALRWIRALLCDRAEVAPPLLRRDGRPVFGRVENEGRTRRGGDIHCERLLDVEHSRKTWCQ